MLPTAWTRRSFMAAALGALSTLVPVSRARAAAVMPGAELGRLALYNVHTREALTVAYRDTAGRYDRGELERLNHLLRCHYTGEVAPIDVRVIEFLTAVDQSLGGGHEIHVISGFRSAPYHAWPVRRGSGVSSHSLHLVGRAIDGELFGSRRVQLPEQCLVKFEWFAPTLGCEDKHGQEMDQTLDRDQAWIHGRSPPLKSASALLRRTSG